MVNTRCTCSNQINKYSTHKLITVAMLKFPAPLILRSFQSLKQLAATGRVPDPEMAVRIVLRQQSITEPAEMTGAVHTGHLVAALNLLYLGAAVRASFRIRVDPLVGIILLQRFMKPFLSVLDL